MTTRTPRGRASARAATDQVLYRIRTVREEHRVRASSDERRRVDRYIVSYLGPGAYEYRKAFETTPGVPPRIPESGTHAELNALAVQWK